MTSQYRPRKRNGRSARELPANCPTTSPPDSSAVAKMASRPPKHR
jgi:hypothetical protein